MKPEEKELLLGCLGACQSAYHIDSTMNHRFGFLPSVLQENRNALVAYVQSLIDAHRQAGQELIWCGCGDGYPPESFEAGVMSVSGQCSNCNMAAAPQPAVERKPLTDEQDRALCEAYCNTASDEYFSARPQLDCAVNRRIFYAGHRKCWIEKAAHGITATQGATHDK